MDVLIESACFKPQNIRATSKKLELRTESSYRYERGADVEICDWASQRAAHLILETSGGELAQGVVDAYVQRHQSKQITLRHAKVSELLGIELKPEQIDTYLGQLGLKPTLRRPQPVDATASEVPPTPFRVPSFRVDLKREVDLIEEVARLHGVDKIPATPPRGAIGANEYDAVHDQLATARSLLTGIGLCEAQGQTLISDSAAKFTAPAEALCPLSNPLSSDMNVLRPSLLPGLLDALRHNLSRNNNDVALFELGRVFAQASNANDSIKESRRVAIALTGNRYSLFWSGNTRDVKFDIYDLKGCVEEFLEQFGVRGVAYTRRSDMTALFVESATVHLGKFSLGELGQVLPTLAKQYDLRDPVFLAELDLGQLLARRNAAKSFKSLPAYPSIRRDVAMLIPEAVTHETVLQVVRQAKPANLETVELFDVFRGKSIPTGQKSVAYAFTYRNPERTLTDVEVGAAHEKLVVQLKERLQAVVRDN